MVKLSKPDYLELCCELAQTMLEQAYIGDYLIEDELGNHYYTEEAQEAFNQCLDAVETILQDNKIGAA